jgi:hypothetical protein
MRRARPIPQTLLTLLLIVAAAAPSGAQEPPPRIPLYVIDVHATFARFPIEQALVDSRGLDSLAELPGAGLGVQIGAHLYPVRWRFVTFGIGGEVSLNRASAQPPQPPDSSTVLQNTEEKFLSASPQLSFNFGSGHGWSYISGGLGVSQWSLIPEGRDEPFPSDTERLTTLNYGGGARWFAKTHVAFSFDLRYYAISAGPPYLDHPGSPRTTLLIIAAGISLK